MVEKKNAWLTARAASYHLSRRNILAGMTAGAALLATSRAATAACALTPRQLDGPFYPMAIQDYDWDLTRVSGGDGRAQGEVIEVTGRVLDATCQPLPGCVIEVWQANVPGAPYRPRLGASRRTSSW